MKTLCITVAALVALSAANAASTITDGEGKVVTLEAGHPSLQHWLLPAEVPAPETNKPTPERIAMCRRPSITRAKSIALGHRTLQVWQEAQIQMLRDPSTFSRLPYWI